MGSSHNWGPIWVSLDIRCRHRINGPQGAHNGPIILRTTRVAADKEGALGSPGGSGLQLSQRT